jgi:hypothetical protein
MRTLSQPGVRFPKTGMTWSGATEPSNSDHFFPNCPHTRACAAARTPRPRQRVSHGRVFALDASFASDALIQQSLDRPACVPDGLRARAEASGGLRAFE